MGGLILRLESKHTLVRRPLLLFRLVVLLTYFAVLGSEKEGFKKFDLERRGQYHLDCRGQVPMYLFLDLLSFLESLYLILDVLVTLLHLVYGFLVLFQFLRSDV